MWHLHSMQRSLSRLPQVWCVRVYRGGVFTHSRKTQVRVEMTSQVFSSPYLGLIMCPKNEAETRHLSLRGPAQSAGS